MVGQTALPTKRRIGESQRPFYISRKRVNEITADEGYKVHTVRVIEESDPPPTHEAAQVRDRIITRSQSSRMTSPLKDPLPIVAEASTSTPRGFSPAREEETEIARQTQNIAENHTNQLLVTILNQMQALCTQLNDTNQRVTDLQDHIFRQEEPSMQPTGIPPRLHHQGSSQKSQLVQPSALPLEQAPGSAKTQSTLSIQPSKGQEPPIPQQSSSLTNQPKERDGYMTREEVQQLIANQLRQGEAGITRRMGRPYPAEYDMTPYPLGYTVPKFKSFNGIGNPIQHLAHFVATCGNTGSNDALLLRQFPQSLTGVAFEWYYSLENGSIRTWAEMEEAFTSKFASISDTVDITTLVNTKMKKDESPVDYITRWRNLSIRCEHPLDQAYAVDTVIANIDNWMSPFLRSNKAHTFQELITQVSRLEKSKVPSASNQFPPPRFKRAESKVVHTKIAERQKGPQTDSTTSPQSQSRPILGGGNAEWKGLSLEQRKNKKYSFRRDKVYKIFKDAMKNGLQLPESKRPEEASKSDDPMYCPYHRILGHTIEDCYVFKDWVEKQYTSGQITLSKSVLTDHTIEQANCVDVTMEASAQQEDVSQGPWELVISKKTLKLLTKLKQMPGVMWKDGITPYLSPLVNPAQKSKKNKQFKKKNKKFINPAKSKEKSAIQEYIDSLEEYEQGIPNPITLRDFLAKDLRWKLFKRAGVTPQELEDLQQEAEELLRMQGIDLGKPNMRVDEPFWTESCRAVSTILEEPYDAGYNRESCNVITLGSDSEEDLCFPEEEEKTTLPGEQNTQSCQMNLRGGKAIPERQPPKEKGKERLIEIRENGMTAESPRLASPEYNVLAHLKKVPALLSIYDALMMSQELRDVLIYALQNPQKF